MKTTVQFKYTAPTKQLMHLNYGDHFYVRESKTIYRYIKQNPFNLKNARKIIDDGQWLEDNDRDLVYCSPDIQVTPVSLTSEMVVTVTPRGL